MAFLDDDEDAGDDIFAADIKTGGKRKDDSYVEIESDDEPVIAPKKVTKSKTKATDEDITMVDVDTKMDDSDD